VDGHDPSETTFLDVSVESHMHKVNREKVGGKVIATYKPSQQFRVGNNMRSKKKELVITSWIIKTMEAFASLVSIWHFAATPLDAHF
jgi:hypothetical protein